MSTSLIRSVSGVRGLVGTALSPELVARYAAAFGAMLLSPERRAVVLARDARTSGPMFAAAARAGLQSVGANVVDAGLVPTPTAQLAVEHHGAAGGIVITASHNPVEWNAMKFVGPDGLFLDHENAERLFALVDGAGAAGVGWDGIGSVVDDPDAVRRHLDAVLGLDTVDVEAVRQRRPFVVIDCVRGAGGTIMPELLERLGCRVDGIHVEPDGRFPRPPEPVTQNLGELGARVRAVGADLGLAVDPDADRLALVDETGNPIGEDYTLAFAVRAVLERRTGPVVVNLSTSLVVDDVAREFGLEVQRAPVGEANVARAMQQAGAVVGGEGNGGVMLPELHLGRDAPVAAALVLDLLSRARSSVSELVARRPRYAIVKAKAEWSADVETAYARLASRFSDAAQDRQDGLRLGWPDRWLHVRPSGTEPIVRAIAEAPDPAQAEALVDAARESLSGGTTG